MRWLREHTKLLIIVAIILLLLIAMIVTFVNKGKTSALGNLVGNSVASVQGPVSWIGNGIAEGFSGFFNFGRTKKENGELKTKVAELNRKIVSLQLDSAELQELKDLKTALNYQGITVSYNYVTADVISIDNSNLFNIFNVNVGTSEGVGIGSAVINGDGLVGRVFSAGEHAAKVISIIDENNSVSFRVFRDVQLLGVLSGNGKGGLNGYMLDAGAAVIEGDILITSGLGSYPAGIVIGKVTEAFWENDQLLKAVTIEPSVRFKNLQKVMIVTPK